MASKDDVLAAFNKADQNGDGLISKEDCICLFKDIMQGWTDEQFDELFAGADVNADGFLDVREFIGWLCSDEKNIIQISFGQFIRAPEPFHWSGVFGVHSGGMDDPDGWIEFEVDHSGGEHSLALRYASGDPRLCMMRVDGNVVAESLASEATGGFGEGDVKWFEQGVVDLGPAGISTISFKSYSFCPHLASFALVPGTSGVFMSTMQQAVASPAPAPMPESVYEPLPPLPVNEDGVLGAGIDYNDVQAAQVSLYPDSMLCGHGLSASVRWEGLENKIIGFTQFVRILNLFEGPTSGFGDQSGPIGKGGIHFGLNGQWLQDRAGGGGAPWGSIEGGIFCSQKLGRSRLPKYHVAASSHRYEMYSDTAGGWGFYEVPIPKQYLARLIISNRMVLPSSGLSFEFEETEEALMFGAGWIAMPLFGGAPRENDDGLDESPLTWTFVCEAENFAGPLCCYPPHMFTRRIEEWSEFRSNQDPNLSDEYLTVEPKMTLGHVGPKGDRVGPSGEIPNLPVVFSDNRNTYWKIPKITLPRSEGLNIWASDFAVYTNENYNSMLDLFQQEGPAYDEFQLVACKDCQVDHGFDGRVHIGVKSVRDRETGMPSYHGVECDHKIRVPVSVKVIDNSVYYEWDADGPEVSRYVKTSNDVFGIIGNGNPGEQFESHWCDFIPEEEAPPELVAVDYKHDAEVMAYDSKASDPAFGGHQESVGDCVLTLEDGAVVTYRWYKFVEQPAMRQLASEYPDFYSSEELERVQSVVEKMHSSWGTRNFLSHSHSKLVQVEQVCLVSPPEGMEIGYVPIAIGVEYPEGNSRARAPEGDRW